VHLLEGPTGSGKTEVYFDTIARTLERGEQVLVLLPEIALSVQWIERCAARFGFFPDMWHSAVGKAAKKDLWRRAAKGSAQLVVGARSALFLPLRNPGLIVVDEEHESSYKQEEGVLYHARDMAIARARHEEIPALLVSATPSLETRANVESGRYRHAVLASRFGGAALPGVTLVDLRAAGLPASRFLSPALVEAAQEHLVRGEQVLLFLNRRGYAPLVLCRACGHRFQCPHCTSWMVAHKQKSRIQCHHCGYAESLPQQCPECAEESKLAACGPGVERIEEEARVLFPDARILTLTSDSAASREEMEAHITRIARREVDIIIGTQLLAKGHHFPHLTLVGIVDADLGLSGGDLRAGERTWQLLHQISGRAGREEKPGRVLVQTWQPRHPVLQALCSGDATALLSREMESRQEAGMPPFGRLAAVLLDGEKEEALTAFARSLAHRIPRGEETAGIRVLGPAPAPLYRLRGRYRMRFLVRAGKTAPLHAFLEAWLGNARPPSSLRLKVDMDPMSFL
jgi:primosomal protein N' (replication factor Y)